MKVVADPRSFIQDLLYNFQFLYLHVEYETVRTVAKSSIPHEEHSSVLKAITSLRGVGFTVWLIISRRIALVCFHMDVTALAQKRGFDVRKNLFLGTRSCDVHMKGSLFGKPSKEHTLQHVPEN